MEYKRMTEKNERGFYKYKCTEEDKQNCCLMENCGECYGSRVLTRLGEIEDKIEQGTLIELPCKVGDKFWCINETKYGMPFVSDMTVAYFKIINGVVYMGEFNCFRIKAWQKSELFLTREEAEKRLLELQRKTKL